MSSLRKEALERLYEDSPEVFEILAKLASDDITPQEFARQLNHLVDEAEVALTQKSNDGDYYRDDYRKAGA